MPLPGAGKKQQAAALAGPVTAASRAAAQQLQQQQALTTLQQTFNVQQVVSQALAAPQVGLSVVYMHCEGGSVHFIRLIFDSS